MRTAFFDTLVKLAEADERIELVVGDLGFGVVDEFESRFPDRFLNAGVAEQNMTGIATGLALAGSVVFTYSIANFPTLRCLEQVRNDVCYHRANVKVVSVGGGSGYGPLGFSHHATEDLAIMRALPAMAVAVPGDPVEAAAITSALAELDGPGYLRINRSGEPVVHRDADRLTLAPGSSVTVAEGDDAAILVNGPLLPTAVEAAEILRTEDGIAARVVSMPWLSPFDVVTVEKAGEETDLVVTLEDHGVIGGLGSATAEVLAEAGSHGPLVRLGLPAELPKEVGTQEYVFATNGLDARSIADRVVKESGSRLRRPAVGRRFGVL